MKQGPSAKKDRILPDKIQSVAGVIRKETTISLEESIREEVPVE